MTQRVRIATRKSALALWQAEYVKARLEFFNPGLVVELVPMSTQGDKILDTPLAKIGGKGLFVKELEVAMQNGEADLAVHSLKDVPMELPIGFELAAVLEREDPRDAFVSNDFASLDALPDGAIIGTSSLRRQAMISARFPKLIIHPLRGNLDTRLSKLDRGEYAAIILAAAGLKRLGMAERIRSFIAPEQSLPAPGQGAMAIEITSGRPELQALLDPLNHSDSERAVRAERTLSRNFGGSCQIPLAAFATIDNEVMTLRAMVATPDGKRVAHASIHGPANNPEALGHQIADALLAQDAKSILAACEAEASGDPAA
jgi:hydroxymethylbilane synthase